MADLALVLVTVGFFTACTAFVAGCDRIVRAGGGDGGDAS
jgi:hypothetical protein